MSTSNKATRPEKGTPVAKGTSAAKGESHKATPEVVTKEEPAAERKFSELRWTIEGAASEFNIDRRTLAKRLKTEGILPGDDDRFSTADICAAKYGDYEKERTRKMKEDADNMALENAKARGELISLPDYLKTSEEIAARHKQRIMGLAIPDADKDALLSDIAELYSDKGGPGPGH